MSWHNKVYARVYAIFLFSFKSLKIKTKVISS